MLCTMTGEELKTIRETKGYGQGDFADQLGVHRTTVLRWERGDLEIPKAVEIAAPLLPARAPSGEEAA